MLNCVVQNIYNFIQILILSTPLTWGNPLQEYNGVKFIPLPWGNCKSFIMHYHEVMIIFLPPYIPCLSEDLAKFLYAHLYKESPFIA